MIDKKGIQPATIIIALLCCILLAVIASIYFNKKQDVPVVIQQASRESEEVISIKFDVEDIFRDEFIKGENEFLVIVNQYDWFTNEDPFRPNAYTSLRDKYMPLIKFRGESQIGISINGKFIPYRDCNSKQKSRIESFTRRYYRLKDKF